MANKCFYISISILSLIPLLIAFKAPKNEINYTFHKANTDMAFYSGLTADYNGNTYELIELASDEFSNCIKGLKEVDFDNDGYKDILIENILGCGGNAMPYNSFCIGFYNPVKEVFELTESFGFSIMDPEYLNIGSYTSIIVENYEEEIYGRRVEHYLLKEGKMVRIKITEELPIPTNIEISANGFSKSDKENGKTIYYDLNADGEKDSLHGEYWDRWGAVIWSVKFVNGQVFNSNSGCKRVGILNTKTKGVNDIVCGINDIWIWNGEMYVNLVEK